jgi:lipoprotein-releasing system permease protein
MVSEASFSRRIALRYLWSRRAEAFINIITIVSVLGVAIGVMVINMVMAVMTGFEQTLLEKLIGADSHIMVTRYGGQVDNWEEVQRRVSAVPGVRSVSPFTHNQVLIRSEARSVGVLLHGLLPGTAGAEKLGASLLNRDSLGELFSPPAVPITGVDGEEASAELPAIVVGRRLAQSLRVAPGDIVSILAPKMSPSPMGMIPKFRRFLVVGVYSSGLIEYESTLAYIDLKTAQQFFELEKSVSGFEVTVADVNAAPIIGKAILNVLDDLGSGFTATDWTVSNQAFWEAIRLEKRVYFIVLLLIIVMASFSIVTTLVMVVIEKRKDIAVMKTLGASSGQIGAIFRYQGAVIGGFGTVLGTVLGLLGCLALEAYGFPINEQVFRMSTVPVRMELANFVWVMIAAFSICFVATIYPARRAASFEPSELLRHD